MIRLVLGWICVVAAAFVWLAEEESRATRAQASAAYAVLAVPLIYFGRRARRRGKKVAAPKQTTPGDVAGIRDKLAGGATAKQKNKALGKAAYAGHIDVVREILASGVDVNATWLAQTPLLAAIHGGHPEIVELLLDHRASLTPKDEYPLIAAAQRSRSEIVELLLRRGADVNAADGKGMTALMHAAENGEADLVRVLLQEGADPNLENEFGYSALALVGGNLIIGKKPDVAVELIEGGAHMSGRFFPHKISILGGVDRDSPIQWSTATGMRDKQGNTLLMIAASKGKRRAVQRLLPDVPVDAVNLAGQTAVDLAEAAGHMDIAAELRQAARPTVNA